MLASPAPLGRQAALRFPNFLASTGDIQTSRTPPDSSVGKGVSPGSSSSACIAPTAAFLLAGFAARKVLSRQSVQKALKGSSASVRLCSSSVRRRATVTEERVEQTQQHRYNSAVGGRTRIGSILNAEGGGKHLIGEKVKVCGWVRTLRAQQTITFLKINDGSTFQELQVVVEGDAYGLEELKSQGAGASVQVEGVIVESPAKGQDIEVNCKDASHGVRVIGTVDTKSYPLAKKRHGPEFMRTIAHLRPRSNLTGSVTRVRNALAYGTHQFFQDRGFLYVHTPIITSSDCEGAGEMFRVSCTADDENTEGGFFGGDAFLTVSGQLNVENYACSLGDVYTFGPTFRAESSNTTRHLAEFWMIEPEMAFADIEDDMQCAEDYLKYCARTVLETCSPDLDFFTLRVDKEVRQRLEQLASPEPYARISYTDAVEVLQEAYKNGTKFEYEPVWGADLQTEHERWLAEEKFKGAVIVYNYPKDIKAFYMRMNEDGKTVAAMDILAPGVGEIVGGSQREERLDRLDARMEEMNLPKEEYWWYRELRQYGSVPHAGFGLGFERLVMLCTGVQNIRDVIPFPRYKGSAEF
mmetsp:Transcript_42244/g.99191  ORF Transcript_42244/g.99191 Transcript_42244/m.99191 type:complete len:581 (+) Transcript_42244:78-1820(+)|eukprot:CAMPEP_0178405590 /NCGR_PEP_ID=MMETSP0689_2-20121128/18478_1 /TAXON_ID=160604 /ORGANISM="Amphidinium massartii, Strain CS-259" /LENGTH=580 /DNA_ID=CAMNT_0020026611 /DNA_START=66 /DNA_END=1808 /DNA_ORIENTATION=-